MRFYSADYLSRHNDLVKTWGFVFLFVLLALFSFYLWTAYRHRLNNRYRQITIIIFLAIWFLAGVQYTDFQTVKAQNNSQSAMANFAKMYAKNQHVALKKVAFNSTTLSDGIVAKEGNQYYQIALSKDGKSYSRTQVYLVADNVEVTE
ncbi:DUF3290 family protein [Leuconostocaceae bacterium ESL0958]|nr:DUF3290 family protein [Leuconostocaceae bacterium ESL0958]